MIIAGNIQPEQLGAFLLLLRYRGETAEELAGFIETARETILPNHDPAEIGQIRPDVDWPSYADRHRQQPWFILSALLLAQNGVRVLMHGIEGETEGYAPTRPALSILGIEPSADMGSAIERMRETGFAYIGLESFLPAIEKLFHLRPVLGLRTLVNTFARAINPLQAPCQLQGVVHPPYRDVHQSIALLLNQPAAIIFKGGGGEVQRNPLKSCRTAWVRDGATGEDEWPALSPDISFDWRHENLAPERILEIWQGNLREPAVEAAIVATTALALHTMGKAPTPSGAESMASTMWSERSV